MSRNGEINEAFGVYKTVCCDAEIVIGVGVPFPDCPNHKNLPTEWKHLSEVDPRRYIPNTAGTIKLANSGKPSVGR